MNGIILYSSQYGHSRRYAQELSRRCGFPAIFRRKAPDLSSMDVVIYIGGLYVGRVPGLKETFQNFPPTPRQRIFVVTVGLTDPADEQHRQQVRAKLAAQLPPALMERAQVFFLRGGLDCGELKWGHRLGMKLLCASISNRAPDSLNAQERAILEASQHPVDFVDFSTLDPILQALQGPQE